MVGPPKRLSDLRRIEANLVVTCRRCRRSKEFDREALLQDLIARRRNTDWYLLPHHFRCACGAKDAALSVVAFADRLRDETRQRFAGAMATVREAVDAAGAADVRTPGLRRALDYLATHCPDPSWCDALYDAASGGNEIAISQGRRMYWRGVLRQLGLPDE